MFSTFRRMASFLPLSYSTYFCLELGESSILRFSFYWIMPSSSINKNKTYSNESSSSSTSSVSHSDISLQLDCSSTIYKAKPLPKLKGRKPTYAKERFESVKEALLPCLPELKPRLPTYLPESRGRGASSKRR